MAKILLIEDNEMNMELAKFLIESAGHECVTAMEGFSGLELAKEQEFDIVLLDIQLPKMDGFAVLKQLRKVCARRVPVIAVSSYAMAGDRERALSAGFDGYITKPIKSAKFVQEVMATAGLS
jgi:CheY-like chemotaxis protein